MSGAPKRAGSGVCIRITPDRFSTICRAAAAILRGDEHAPEANVEELFCRFQTVSQSSPSWSVSPAVNTRLSSSPTRSKKVRTCSSLVRSNIWPSARSGRRAAAPSTLSFLLDATVTAAPSRQLLWPLQNRIRTEAKDDDPFALQAHPDIFRLMKFCPFHVSRITGNESTVPIVHRGLFFWPQLASQRWVASES
jgi:hypothetical protein